MSEGSFQVSLPAVDELSARVLIAASDVRSATSAIPRNVCVDTGDASLSAAFEAFTQFWGSASVDAAHGIDSTASTMSAAAVQYGYVDSHVMVDPAITGAFVDATVSGDSGAAQLLLGPLLPGAGR